MSQIHGCLAIKATLQLGLGSRELKGKSKSKVNNVYCILRLLHNYNIVGVIMRCCMRINFVIRKLTCKDYSKAQRITQKNER